MSFPSEFQSVVRAQFEEELSSTIGASTQLSEVFNQRLRELSVKEDHYLDLVGDPDWPANKLRAKMQHIRIQREKLLIELDKLDADLKTGRGIFLEAL